MKKFILAALIVCQALSLSAQDRYKMKVILKNGTKMVALTDDVTELVAARVGTAQVNLSERYHTSTSVSVNMDFDANVGRVKAVCVPATQTIADPKDYIEKNAQVDAKNTFKKSFDFLEPETDYKVYALAYTLDGYPAEVTSLDVKTGKAEDDPFEVETTAKASSVDYTVTPKGDIVKFYTICTGVDTYEDWVNEAGVDGDVMQHFVAWWKMAGSWYGSTWQEEMWFECYSEPYSETQGHLLWDADQVVVSFGVNKDGTLASAIQVDKVHTLAPKASTMNIGLELQRNAFRDVVVKATPSTDDEYFVTVQPASWVEKYKDDASLLKALCYEADNITPSQMSRTRDTDDENGVWEFRPNKAGEKYYVIACGLDGDAPTTASFMLEFQLPE